MANSFTCVLACLNCDPIFLTACRLFTDQRCRRCCLNRPHSNLSGATITMPRCFSNCPRESTTSSGITRHRQACNKYRAYIKSIQIFGRRVRHAKLKARKAKFLQAQRREPENMPTDGSVAFPSTSTLVFETFLRVTDVYLCSNQRG